MSATVGVLRIRLRLPAHSLKEKRMVVKSVIERVRTRFNAAASELEDLDTPGIAAIAVACISNDIRHCDQQLQVIARAIAEWRLDAEVLDVETELITL
jgi:uncharacterized protein YlxP (DUF503 family)